MIADNVSGEYSTSTKILLGAGDVIEIKFFYTPELNESQTIRPDGKIALQLVGDIDAAGIDVTLLKDKLVKLYTPHLRNPEITVIVRSLFSNRIYVGGEVNKPGYISLPGPMSALNAIFESGGFNYETASIGNVVIIRHEDGKRYGAKLDLTDALKGKTTVPFYLKPYDIVFVPRTRITSITQWIDRNIYSLIPAGFLYTKQIGNVTAGINTSLIRD
ncbi:MAG: sugar transporter [bacterium]|nr:sugar transporter [bacterium]